jgi:hypothetical protein
MLAAALRSRNVLVHAIDDFGLTSTNVTAREAAAMLGAMVPADISVPLPCKALSELKFSSCLPTTLPKKLCAAASSLSNRCDGSLPGSQRCALKSKLEPPNVADFPNG